MKTIFNYFLQGLLFIAPLGITSYIIYLLFNFVDNILNNSIESFFGIYIPGLGFVIIFLFLVLVGIIGQSIVAKPFKLIFNRVIEKVPLLNLVFSAFSDLFTAIVGKEKKFTKPVLVMVNAVFNLEKIGFLTEEDLSKLDEKEKVAVYFPHSYNFSGELFIVPRDQVRVIDVSPAIVMKFVVSGGVSGIGRETESANQME
jgi:uncharacterized membrane protein